MALSREAKTVKVEKLAGELQHSTSAIIGTFTGLTASKDFELRKTVRAAGGSYHVVKNKLAAKASMGSQLEAALQGLKGVSSVAYTSGDPVALAKALSTWVKDNAEFTFKLGIVDGNVISVAEIGALATLPSKEELFSKLLFLIQSPAQRLATVINAAGRDLAVVINQAVENEKFAGSPMATHGPSAVVSPGETVSQVSPSDEASAAAEPATTSGPSFVNAERHAEESAPPVATPPEQQIAEHPAAEADPVQADNSTVSHATEVAAVEPDTA